MEDKKVKLLVYATESERTRIKLAATRLGMSMTQFMLDSIMVLPPSKFIRPIIQKRDRDCKP